MIGEEPAHDSLLCTFCEQTRCPWLNIFVKYRKTRCPCSHQPMFSVSVNGTYIYYFAPLKWCDIEVQYRDKCDIGTNLVRYAAGAISTPNRSNCAKSYRSHRQVLSRYRTGSISHSKTSRYRMHHKRSRYCMKGAKLRYRTKEICMMVGACIILRTVPPHSFPPFVQPWRQMQKQFLV